MGRRVQPRFLSKKTRDSTANLIKSTKVFMATPQGRRLGYHAPEQVSNQEPLDYRPCVSTTAGAHSMLCYPSIFLSAYSPPPRSVSTHTNIVYIIILKFI